MKIKWIFHGNSFYIFPAILLLSASLLQSCGLLNKIGSPADSTSTSTSTSNSNSTLTSTSTSSITSTSTSSSVATPFVALHTYFLSPNGSDSNNGLTAETPWATANHSVNCGDVIVAAPGSYNAHLQGAGVGTVSNCPSTYGGINGTGGIYFAVLLCGGPLGSCTITGNNNAFVLTNSNWAIEGWQISGLGPGNTAFEPYSCTPGRVLHHFAFINNVTYNMGQTYGTNNCGISGAGKTSPGSDYVAVVGNIAQNAAQNPICLAAIDGVSAAQYDAIPGTHIYFYGNVAWGNVVTCNSDGEAFMFDTLDGDGFQGTAIMANNIAWGSERYGIQVFDQNINSNTPTVKLYNNTLFANNNDTHGSTGDPVGEINIQSVNASSTSILWTINSYNNIAKTNFAKNSSGEVVYAEAISGGGPNVSVGGAGSQNFFKGALPSCEGYGPTCDPGFNVMASGGGILGTNIYADPLFTNTSDLLSNQNGVPNCSSFSNVTACMGWDATTGALTTPSVISDFVPTANGTAGKGYQLPTTTCAPNSDYPNWLKGIVYLQWNGSSLTENSGLVSKPCGM